MNGNCVVKGSLIFHHFILYLGENKICSHAGPVVGVDLLVAMVVRVVIVLPLVILGVHVVFVDVLAHVDVGEHIFQLGIVVERNGREWVEVVGVHNLGLGHTIVLSLLRGCLLASLVGFVCAEVKGDGSRVDKEVSSPSHLADGTQSV